MLSISRRRGRAAAGLLLASLLCGAAFAQGLSDFTLAKAIPADCYLAVHTRAHAGQEFLNAQFSRVSEEFFKAGFDRDFKRLLKQAASQGGEPMDEAAAAKFDETWAQIGEYCSAIDWGKLSESEYAMGLRLGTPFPEFIVMMKSSSAAAEKNFQGLSSMAKHLVGLTQGALTLNTEDGPPTIHRIMIQGAPAEIGLGLARKDDVILFCIGSPILEQSLALLGGEGSSLASTDRFQQAVSGLPMPADTLHYFDAAKMFQQIRPLLAMIPTPPDAPEEVKAKFPAMITKLVDMVDVVEFVAMAGITDGKKTTSTAVSRMRSDAGDRALYQLIASNPPLSEPLKFVPATATNFSAASGVNLAALYRTVRNFLANDMPEGEQAIAEIDAMQQQMQLDIEKDVLGWIQGATVSYSIPGPTAFSPGEWAFLVGVSDEPKAREVLTRLIDHVRPLVGQQAQLAPAEIAGADGFTMLNSPMLAMAGLTKPVFGVHSGWLVLASSPDQVTSLLATASGSAENIASNERFKSEGLLPSTPVTGVSFSDLTGLGDQLGQMMSMIPMMSMGMPDLAKNPAISSAFSMVGKLGRVMRKLDFFQSSASLTTREGDLYTTRTVVTYREPPTTAKPGDPQ